MVHKISIFDEDRDAWRKKQMNMGKCIDCKRDALKPNKRCAVHLAQVKAAQARREEVKRAQRAASSKA